MIGSLLAASLGVLSLGAAALAARPGRRSRQARRDPDLCDSGGRAAEFRRSPRGHLRDVHATRAVLQRADQDQFRITRPRRPTSSATCARRLPQPADDGKTYTFKIRDGAIPRRLAADRRRRSGELGAHHSPAERGAEPAPELVHDGRRG